MTENARPGRDRTTSGPAAAVGVWAVLFAALHWYWASGGRAGLGNAADEADRALATGWFAAYNAGVAAVLTLGAVLMVPAVLGRVGTGGRRRLAQLGLLGAVVLLGRGWFGLALLVPELLDGTARQQPTLLLLVEPWFVLGGVLFLLLRRSALRRHPAVDAARPARAERELVASARR